MFSLIKQDNTYIRRRLKSYKCWVEIYQKDNYRISRMFTFNSKFIKFFPKFPPQNTSKFSALTQNSPKNQHYLSLQLQNHLFQQKKSLLKLLPFFAACSHNDFLLLLRHLGSAQFERAFSPVSFVFTFFLWPIPSRSVLKSAEMDRCLGGLSGVWKWFKGSWN